MKYNSIGEQLIAKAKELDPNYKPDKFNDMSEALDVILNNTGGSGSGIPVVEGTLVEEESTENTKYYTIPETQTSPFIFHSSDIGYVFIDVLGESYSGIISANSYTWALFNGSETTLSFSLYSPASFYNINFSGNLPRDETSSVDVTFPLTDRYTNSICLVTDIDVTIVFLKDGNSIFGSFQTPIIHCNDGKYRYWSMDAKEGDTTNTLVTIKCKVVNLDGGGGSAASVQQVNAYGEGGGSAIEKGKISTDLTDVDLKIPFVLNIYEDSTLSGTSTRIVMTNKVGENYYLGTFNFLNHYLVQMTKGTDGKYSYSSNIIPNPIKNTIFNKPILVPENLADPTPILPCTTADNGKVLSVVNGEAQWASVGGGSVKIDLYQHNIVLIDNPNSEYLYIKHISSKQSEVTSIADLNTLLGTGTYTFGCSGEVKINNTWYNAVAIYWDESYAKSLVMYNVPGEGEKTAALTIYTSVTDTVTPV